MSFSEYALWQQLGGQRQVSHMIGISYSLGDSNKNLLKFKFKVKAKNRANWVHITLAPDDTYTVEFRREYVDKNSLISKHEGIYADNIKSFIEQELNLYLSLKPLP
jgi:hypothetical protein